MWPYSWTHVGTPSHLGHMDRVAGTMPSQAHAGAAQEAPNIGQWEGQDVPLVRPSSCIVKGGIPSPRRYLPTYLPLDRLVERVCIEQNCGNPLPSSDLPEVCEPRISKVSFVHPRTKKVSLQDRICDWSKGLQHASPSELTSEESQTLSLKANDRPLPFSGISGDPVTIFRTRDRCVRSVIEADAEHPNCQEDRDRIYNRFKDTVFKEGGNHWSEIENNMDKRGPNGICVLEPIPDAKPKADKPIRAVGLREKAMREKIKEFQEKGWIVPSQSHWVSRGFLVPKPGTNKWRLVIDLGT